MQITKKLSTLILLCVGVLSFTTSKAQLQTGKKIEINSMSAVYVVSPVKEAYGQALGNYLVEMKYFDTELERAVRIVKKGKAYIVQFVVDVAYLKQHPELRKTFQEKKLELSKNVFDGSPVIVELVTPELKKA